MARRKKRRLSPDETADGEEQPYKSKAPGKLNNPFAAALAGVSAPKKETLAKKKLPLKKKKAPQGFVKRLSTYEERVIKDQAYAGVRPLGGGGKKKRAEVVPQASVAAKHDDAEQAARARLGNLVGGAVAIIVSRDRQTVSAARKGTHPSIISTLEDARPNARLDLHGMTESEADQALCRFVRTEHKHGQKFLLVIHGKGSHSAGGIGVLADVCVRVLSRGGAAPLVTAFATAHRSIGGEGALVVRLTPSKR